MFDSNNHKKQVTIGVLFLLIHRHNNDYMFTSPEYNIKRKCVDITKTNCS